MLGREGVGRRGAREEDDKAHLELEVDKVLVHEWMTKDVVTVSPHTSVLNARRLLEGHGIRHLPVVDDGRVVGMLSDRDVLIRDQQVAQGLSVLQSELLAGQYRPVAAMMSAPPRVVSAGEPVVSAVRNMLARRISALPVLEAGGLVGIITISDCLRGLVHELGRPRSAVRDDDPEWYKPMPMPPGDERPGRPAPPSAEQRPAERPRREPAASTPGEQPGEKTVERVVVAT